MGDGQKTGVGKRGARGGGSIAPSLLIESSPNLTV